MSSLLAPFFVASAVLEGWDGMAGALLLGLIGKPLFMGERLGDAAARRVLGARLGTDFKRDWSCVGIVFCLDTAGLEG